MSALAENGANDWEGAGAAFRCRRPFRWSELLWALIFPSRRQRTTPTIAGLVLIGLALGIGSAAYNTASNILFITLSLLLACLILSGLMSWMNIRALGWRLLLQPPLRAGQEAPVTLELWNRRRALPAYGLWFELEARPLPAGVVRAESTVTATSADIKAAWTGAEPAARTVVPLSDRLDPGRRQRLDWLFTPPRRGRLRVELTSVGSLFPFGFLRKRQGTRLRREAVVWPAPVAYRFLRAAASRQAAEGRRVARPGTGHDLLALRRYQPGDSHRLIHWKASARVRQLLVRQLAADSAEGYALRIDASATDWPRPQQFELLVSFAATLAEDLFREGRLRGAAVNGAEALAIRHLRDLECFLDQLALLEPDGEEGTGRAVPATPAAGRHLITFAPDGARGVVAFVDGEKSATA